MNDPHNPGQKWPKDNISTEDFWRYLRGANGADGRSAYEIWKDGVEDGTISWNEGTDVDDFFRYLKGEDGKDGDDGKDGKSAYDLWKEAVKKGLENPHKPGETWPKDKVELKDFWEYLRGEDGKDGQDGQDGNNSDIDVVRNKYNVIAQYYYNTDGNKEYINWNDGSVTYLVLNSDGEPVADGTWVKLDGTRVTNKDYSYSVQIINGRSFIHVDPQYLPETGNNDDNDALGYATVKEPDKNEEQTANNTFVPVRVKVRLAISTNAAGDTKKVTLRASGNVPAIQFYVKPQRKLDSKAE